MVRREREMRRAKACTAYDGPVTGEQGRMEQRGQERGTGGDTVPRRLFDGPGEDVNTRTIVTFNSNGIGVHNDPKVPHFSRYYPRVHAARVKA